MKEKSENLAKEMALNAAVKSPGDLRAKVAASLNASPLGVDEECYFRYTRWDRR